MTQFVDADETDVLGKEVKHPSFGMIQLHNSQGRRPLFGVDYPTGNSLSLKITTGRLMQKPTGDWYYSDKEIIAVELSEVQWARLVASVNTTGVPCTIRRRIGDDGKYVMVDDPPEHMRDAAQMRKDVEGLATRVANNMEHIRKLCDELAKPGASVTKAKVQEIATWVQQTQQAIESDMPFLTQTQIEQVDEMVQSAKAEVDAHIQFQLNELGKRALGEEIKKGGVAISVGGRQARLEAPKEDEDGEA